MPGREDIRPRTYRRDNRADNHLGNHTIQHTFTFLPVSPGKTIGSRLRYARIKSGLTMAQLADLAGVTVQTIQNAELRNKVSLPALRKYSKILNVPIHFLGCFEELPERSIGEKLRKARLYRGLTKKELAMIFKVNAKTIWNWETDTSTPSISTEALNKFLEILLPRP